ncbi:hypothetical protein EV128_12575 [Rhizobium azibense]|nr:hypothetical protein EV128_12575 [Rhizobium azibense]
MTDWNAYLEELINLDTWPKRFEERYLQTTPEVKAGIEELRQIEANVATVQLLKGRYEVRYQIPTPKSSARLFFIRARRYPFHLMDFLVIFSYVVGDGLTHEVNKDFKQREPVTIEEATKRALDELKYIL